MVGDGRYTHVCMRHILQWSLDRAHRRIERMARIWGEIQGVREKKISTIFTCRKSRTSDSPCRKSRTTLFRIFVHAANPERRCSGFAIRTQIRNSVVLDLRRGQKSRTTLFWICGMYKNPDQRRSGFATWTQPLFWICTAWKLLLSFFFQSMNFPPYTCHTCIAYAQEKVG